MNKDTQQVEAHEEAQVKAQEAQVTREDGTKLALSRHQVLNPLLDMGLIEMTIPDKPHSSNQRYRLTEKGSRYLQEVMQA